MWRKPVRLVQLGHPAVGFGPSPLPEAEPADPIPVSGTGNSMSRIIIAFAALSALLSCSPDTDRVGGDSPAMVVLVSVDQLRADLLDEYAPAFSHGFVRLAQEGAVFTGASHRHATTSTAVGHTTLSTGVVPTRHGIVANDWWERTGDGSMVSVYSVEDTLSPIVGFPGAEGRSPRNIYVDGLADWILATDPGARVVSISKKDRAAIPMAGHTRGHVYWIQEEAGAFVTSTYYRDANPGWLDRFNAERMPEILGSPNWERATPDSLVGLARRDAYAYEGDGEHTAFPHLRSEEREGELTEAQYRWTARTPAPDRALLELAKVALDELQLGRREGGLDYLALSFSQTDYIGHDYGPMSQEQLDNLQHLDHLLGELMEVLDQTVGEGRWVMGLSADHGVRTIPEWAAEQGEDSRRLSREEIRRLREVADEAADAAMREGIDVQESVAAAVEEIPWVQEVFLPREVVGEPADSFAALFGRSFSETRHTGSLARYELYLQLESGVLLRSDRQGTSHGSPYWHDRHVPFILFGGGLEATVSGEPVFTYQMAPTLAHLAGVPVPAELDGEPVRIRSGGSP
jgi:predicted AlkP superfamily pyrophosphatase or phosphodiesterase